MIVGGPISGWIMGSLDGRIGLANWQWLFLLEGIPSIVVGLLALAIVNHARRATIGFGVPTIIQGFGATSKIIIGLLSAVPYIGALIGIMPYAAYGTQR